MAGEKQALEAELEQLRSLVKHLNPAGLSLRELLLRDARRRDFIDLLQAEAARLRANAAADQESARAAAELPKNWHARGARQHFVAIVAGTDAEQVVVMRTWHRRAQVWTYRAEPLRLVQFSRALGKGVARG